MTTVEEVYSPACDLCKAAQNVTEAVGQLDGEHESLNDAVKLVKLDEIAKRFGVPITALKRRLGLLTTRTAWTEEMVRGFTNDVNEGMTSQELGEKYALSKSRVTQLIAKFEIDPTPGRRTRARKNATRFQDVSEMVLYVYDLEPDLNVEAMHAWIGKQDTDMGITLAEVQDVVTKIGLVTGDLDAMPKNGNTRVVNVNRVPREVQDHKLPEPDEHAQGEMEPDDVVEVPARQMIDWLKDFYAGVPDGTIEDYAEWAGKPENEGAPRTTAIRNEYGSWRTAKKTALKALQTT